MVSVLGFQEKDRGVGDSRLASTLSSLVKKSPTKSNKTAV